METSPFLREALVVGLSIAGPIAAASLWTRNGRNSAVLLFLVFTAAMLSGRPVEARDRPLIRRSQA